MRIAAADLTDDQMRAQRAAELRKDTLRTRWDVVHAIDRVRGHAWVDAWPGDRELIAEAWNADHAEASPEVAAPTDPVRRAAIRLVSFAALGGRPGEQLQELVMAALTWARADREARATSEAMAAPTSPELDAILGIQGVADAAPVRSRESREAETTQATRRHLDEVGAAHVAAARAETAARESLLDLIRRLDVPSPSEGST